MRLLSLLLVTILLMATANAQLERGTKGNTEDVILVSADDWHSSVAATPLAIWSEDNRTVVNPLLILPKKVDAGVRMGWVEQADLNRYGVASVLHTLKSANITAITIHGDSDLTKAFVEAAHKEGLKAYVTASLEPPKAKPKLEAAGVEIGVLQGEQVLAAVKDSFLDEMGLDDNSPDESALEADWLQQPNPSIGGNASLYCSVNPEARESLFNQLESLIDDYKVDGVVLYEFGFQDENYCFCDVCKEEFYKDTGIDLSKIYANSYNLERWRQWKQDQVMEIVEEAKNITTDLGPVELGVAVGSPFDRSQGYNYPDISKVADFTLISPSPSQDISLAAGMTEKPVYIRLSDDYVEYVLSTQNVDGTVKYIEDLNEKGAGGFAFEYDVVYTPLWSELEPPSQSAQWLLQKLGGRTLGIGNVSWRSDSWINANNSFDMARRLSERWERSPGAVIVGENYSAGLSAAPLASYLNWPILFTGNELPEETASALRRLGAEQVAIVGEISEKAKNNLSEMNLTLIEDKDLLVKEMASRNESPSMVVLTNSHDLSLLPPVPETEIKRDLIGDLLVRVEISPSEIPAEELGEIVRMNITMTNTGPDILRDVRLLDIFPSGRLITWPRQDQGTVNVTDPYTGVKSDVTSAFLNGSLLRWRLDELGPDKSAILTMDVEILHPMDAGWKREFDGGVTASYEGLTYNLTVERKDDWPVVNITYPSRIYSGMANISWNLDRTSSFTTLNLYSPNGRSGSVMIRDTSPGKLYSVKTPLITPGVWKFNIEAGDGYTHRTENYTITVKSAIEPTNITAFSHTKVPRTSLVAAQAAAARKAVLVDLAKVPQKIDPLKEEEALKQKIDDLKLSPQYLMVVGDPGSMPFISTGIMQKPLETKPFEFEVYRDYRIDTDDDNYTETSTGRIMGLSVYDASQLMARTFAYDRLTGAWKQNALVISSPPLTFPQDPIAMSIRDYLAEAGLKVRDLRYEEASYQIVASQMDNGQNIVHFSSHGSEDLWSLSSWSKVDPGLDDTHVKQLTLAPQTTSAAACATSNLKGYTLNVSDIQIYVPLRLDDSIALAFIRAGAVNYIGSNSLSWIFVSDDHAKRFHQALIFENDTVGQALAKADNLYRLKLEGAEQIKSVSDYEEMFAPSWDYSVKDMLNQTAGMNIILGDPSFRPYLPKTPPLPYVQETKPYNQTAQNESGLETSITAKSDSATDWIYWIETDTTDGELRLNAPPALIGEVLLPKDADKIIVKENGRAVWHDEDVVGDQKRVMWPIVRPKLNETRTFQVEYVLIPGQVQVINVTAGWNSVSIYLQPKDSAIDKYLKNKPYRSVFSAMGGDWDFSMKDTGASNVTEFEPGRGYLIDSSENFTIELEGKPVEFPYRMKLLKGWNMIGVPINKTVDVNNITVNAEHKRYKYPEAVGKGIISAFIWSYNDGLGWSHLGENDTLEPGKAYLVEAMSECRLEFRE